MGGKHRFDAFVSYSTDPDYALVQKVESFLESFHRRVPKEVRDELTELKVCVDGSDFRHSESSPSENPVPSEPIREVVEENLAASRALLVLCSRKTAAEDSWANKEIKTFLRLRNDPQAIHLAMTEGDDLSAELEDLVPPAAIEAGLHRRIWFDFRGGKGRDAAEWKKVRDLNQELVRLAADLNGRPAGEILPLWQQEESRRAKLRMKIGFLATAVVAILVALVLIFRGDAQEQKERRAAESSRKLAARSEEIVKRDPAEAFLLALDALAEYDGEEAKEALRTAYRILIIRELNRRSATQLTGDGPSYLAGRWKQGEEYSVPSEDGRYTLSVSRRGADGASERPSWIQLLDNETLNQLDLEFEDEINKRVEFVGFDRAQEQIFAVRQFRLEVFNMDGTRVGAYNFSRHTKSPVHHIAGFLDGGYVLGAESKGGVWLVDPLGERQTITVRGERARDPVLSTAVSDDGKTFLLVHESGKVSRVRLPAEGAKAEPERVGILGVEHAVFAENSDTAFLTAGSGGSIWQWAIKEGKPERNGVLRDEVEAFTWCSYSSDGRRVLGITDDFAVVVFDLESRKVERRHRDLAAVDWKSRQRLTGSEAAGGSVPPIDVGGRKWIASARGAILEEDGVRYRVTERFERTRGIVHAGGATWILTGSDTFAGRIGPTYRVEGIVAIPLPRRIDEVTAIREEDGVATIVTKTAVWERRGGRYHKREGGDSP